MSKTKILFSILAILFGVFIIVYGGIDDSPGAQLIGLITVFAGIISLVKDGKKFFKTGKVR